VADELGAPYRPLFYADRFGELAAAAGLPRIPLHGGRHCAASLLADLGIPDVAVAAWLGHTQVTVTHNYQHVMAARLAEASRALGEALTGPSGDRSGDHV
jgi:integrase